MSYHGSPLNSQANAIERLAESYDRKADQYRRGVKWKRVKHPEAYARVCAETERVGLTLQPPRSQQQVLMRMSASAIRREVTMPTFSWSKPVREPRVVTEERAVERIEQAVALLRFALQELSETPNPNSTFQNTVVQKELVEAIRRLRFCVHPPLPDEEKHSDVQPRVQMPLVAACVQCGGPGRIGFQGELFCEECCPQRAWQRHQASKARMEQDRTVRAMSRDVKALDKIMRKITKSAKREEPEDVNDG